MPPVWQPVIQHFGWALVLIQVRQNHHRYPLGRVVPAGNGSLQVSKAIVPVCPSDCEISPDHSDQSPQDRVAQFVLYG
jgi:hypothetical protein